jgi:hypothetical protein
MLILKIYFKKIKKYYFNIFLNKKNFKQPNPFHVSNLHFHFMIYITLANERDLLLSILFLHFSALFNNK